MDFEPGYDVYEYSRKGDVQNLRAALSGGSKPDQYLAYDGSSALVMAARSGHAGVVRELLRAKASVETRTDEGSTVMHHAVSGGNIDAVALLQVGNLVNEPNEDGVTPLILAAHYGRAEIVEALCDAGANVNHEAEGWGTALDAAQGQVAAFLERRGAVRSSGGADQPLARGAERFHYGCFEAGVNPTAMPAVVATTTSANQALMRVERKIAVGDNVKLKQPKMGLLQEGDVGKVVHDDGSDCVPLKVQLGESYDYYDHADLVVCDSAKELPPDSDRATSEGTMRYLQARLSDKVAPSVIGDTGLHISPVGFGCHRLEDDSSQRSAMGLALQLGCNFIDLAPNYTDGVAESVAGTVLSELISGGKLRRDEVVVATKVGNILGRQMPFAKTLKEVAAINDNLWHSISPAWIEQEVGRSLERLQLTCVDCVLLHCPEFESKAEGVDMDEVYARLGRAFAHLETEVARGRVAMYGVSAAFTPLRPTDPEHLDLSRVLAQLPDDHHFRVLQFPMNYAEANTYWIGHTERRPDGTAIDKERGVEAPTLFELAKQHGLTTLINRPLDGIYKESHGVLRFSSLDCDVRSFSELQLDNCDVLEEKVTKLCDLSSGTYGAGDGASGQLAAKTVKVLSSLENVDCVLLGMRRPEYVIGTLPMAFGTPKVPAAAALTAFKAVHNTVAMWFATAIHEADHGTSKTWRLPMEQKYVGA